MGQRVGKWVGGWVGGWVDGWVGGWVNGSASGWVDGWVGGWVGEWASGWVGGCVSEWVSEWASGWVRGWVGEWVREVLQAWHLAWSGVPPNYRNATVASRRRLLPKKLIVAQITNKLLSAHPNQRIVFVFISCHGLQFALFLRSVLMSFGQLVYFRLSLLFRVSDQNSVHISRLCPSPLIGLQPKRLNCSPCSSAGTPATSLQFSAPSAQRPSVCARPIGHKCNSLLGCDTA